MDKKQMTSVAQMLQKQLDMSEQMWENKESHARIIGFLQGTIKGLVDTLEISAK